MSTLVVQPSSTNIVVQSPTTKLVVNDSTTKVVPTNNAPELVVVQTGATKLVSIAQQGPPGPTGATGVEEVPYRKIIDFITDDLLYKGEALPGTLKGDAGWRIQKIVIEPISGDTDISFAGGSADFNKVWDNRELETYL